MHCSVDAFQVPCLLSKCIQLAFALLVNAAARGVIFPVSGASCGSASYGRKQVTHQVEAECQSSMHDSERGPGTAGAVSAPFSMPSTCTKCCSNQMQSALFHSAIVFCMTLVGCNDSAKRLREAMHEYQLPPFAGPATGKHIETVAQWI